MSTVTYNGHEITSVHDRSVMRKALATAERRGTEAAAEETGVNEGIIKMWCAEAGIIDKYGRYAMNIQFVDAKVPRTGEAFISFYASDDNNFRISRKAAHTLGIEKGDGIKLARDESEETTHFFVAVCENGGGDISIVGTGGNSLAFNASGLVSELGLEDLEESVRFYMDTEPRYYDGMTLYKATLRE